MAREKETQVNKSNSFEEWRQSTNETSLDLGAVAGKASYTYSELSSGSPTVIDNLDAESRIADSYKTVTGLENQQYVRDHSSTGLKLDYIGDTFVDNTQGYIILKDGVVSATASGGGGSGNFINAAGFITLKEGDTIKQYLGNNSGGTEQFKAQIVSVSERKILIRNIEATASFDPLLNIYTNAGSVAFVNSTYIKELVVESYKKTSARVYVTRNYTFSPSATDATNNHITLTPSQYKSIRDGDQVTYVAPASNHLTGTANATAVYYVKKISDTAGHIELYAAAGLTGSAQVINSNSTVVNHTLIGNRTALEQGMVYNGFHVPPHAAYATHSLNTAALGNIKQFIENEVVYQGNNPVNDFTFKATLLRITPDGTGADTSGIAGSGSTVGLIIFKNILGGTYSSSTPLKAATTLLGGDISVATSISASSLTSALTFTDVNVGQMIEFNTEGVVGDDIKIYHGSAVDAILEVQDDIGNIADLGTINKNDVVQSINELETAIRGASAALVSADLASTTNRPAFTAVDLVGAVIEHETDLYGTGSQTLSSLNTNDTDSFVDAINELELGIRGTVNKLIGENDAAGGLLYHASNNPKGMTANNLLAGLLEHEKDLFGDDTTTGGKKSLSDLGTNDQTSIVLAINELETAIRGSDGTLVGTDLGATVTNYDRAGTNLTDLLEEIHHDVGNTSNANLGELNTPDVDNVPTVGTAAATTNTITFASGGTAGIVIGMFVTGSGNLPDNARVIGINPGANTITLSGAIKTGGIAAAVNLSFKVEDITTKVKGLDTAMGAVTATNMGTAASTLTTAIREHNDELYSSGVSFTGLAAANFQDAIEELRVDIGDVGNSGANLTGSVFNSSTDDLKKAVLALGVAATGTTEFDTAFHASNSGSLAHAAGYSATNLHEGITQIQNYLGDVSTLSTDAFTPITSVNHLTTAASAASASITVNTTPVANSAVNSGTYTLVDVGYVVTLITDAAGNDAVVPANTVVIKKNANGNLILNNAVTLSVGDTLKLSEPANSFGFNDDNVVSALLELKAALVGGTADLSDKIATLDDSDGAATDFDSTNIVDAIRKTQDHLGQRSAISSPINGANAGTFNSDTYTNAINSILTVIGSENISGIHGTTHTLTHTIKKLHDELGDVTAVNMGTTASTVVTAIKELHDEIGSSNISTVSGTDNTITTAINQLHYEIGDVAGSNTRLGVGSDRTIATSSSAASPNTGVILNLVNTLKLVPGMTVSGTGIAAGATIVSVDSGNNRVTLSADGITTSITTGSPVNITFRAETLQVKALALDTNTGNVAAIATATGYSATDLVGGLTEIQGKIGNVSAANMGTTASTAVTAINELATTKLAIGASAAAMQTAMGTNSSTVTAAIKELVDGTGATAIEVKGVASQASTGKLNKVSAAQQILLGDIAFNSPDTSDANALTTFTFGANTILDLSASVLKTNAANGTFNTTASKIVLGATTKDGQGLEIDRGSPGIADGLSTGVDASILWVDTNVTATDPSTGFNKSNGTAGSAHNLSDLAWQISGFKYAADGAATTSTQANLDFQNAYRLFGIGTNNTVNTNTDGSVQVTWNETNQNFGIKLSNTTADLTSGGTGASNTWGTSAKVPQLDIDRQGRVIGVTEVAISDALGTFTLKADSGSDQVIGVNESIDIDGGTNITTTISETGGANTVSIALDASPSVTNLTASGKLIVQGTDAANPSTFAGDVTIGGVCRADLFTQTGGGTSLSFTSTSAEISTTELILNAQQTGTLSNTTNESSSARIIAHRGFDSTSANWKTGRDTTLTIGKRYRIEILNPIATEQAAINTLAGTTGVTYALHGIFTAALQGNNSIDTTAATGVRSKFAEQLAEAKIAWNEATDKWDLYNGTDAVTGSIVTQGDALPADMQFTSTEDDDSTSLRLLMHGNATASGDASTWPASDYVGALKSDNALKYNSATNLFTIVAGRINADDGESTFGDILADNTRAASSGNITSKGLTKSLGGMLIENASPFIKFNETGLQVDVNGTLTDSPVEWWAGGDGANFSVRMNNLANYPFEIQTTNALNNATKAVKDIYLRPGVGGNLNVQGPINGIGLLTNRLNSSSTPLSKTAGTRLTQANFTGLVGENGGNQSALHIQDVRITTVGAATNRSAATASKRIAHAVDGVGYSFIDFQGSDVNYNEIRLGGYRDTTHVKTFLKGQTSGPTELYNNEANNNASLLRLSTKSSGVRYYGALLRNRDLPTVGYTGNNVNSPFESTVPIADVKGNTVTYSTHEIIDGAHVLIDPAPPLPAAGTTATQFVIRGGANGSGGYSTPFTRTTGLSLKMSSESTAGESGKGYDIYSQSTQAYANNPDLYFARSDGKLRQVIQNNGDIAFYKGDNLGSQTKGLLWDTSEGHLAIGNRDHIIQTDMVASEWAAFGNGPQALLHITGGNTAGNVRADAKLIVEADGGNESGVNAELSNPIIQLRSDGTLRESEFKHNGVYNEITGYLKNSTIISDQGDDDQNSDEHAIQFATGGNATRQTGGRIDSIARMTILNNGKVGIGTNNPILPLHVNGNMVVGNNYGTGSYIQVKDIVAGATGIGASESAKANKTSIRINAGESYTHASAAYAHSTTNGESVYINAEGGIIIHSHSDNWSSDSKNHTSAGTLDGVGTETGIAAHTNGTAQSAITQQSNGSPSTGTTPRYTYTGEQIWAQRNTTHIGKSDGSATFGGNVTVYGTMTSQGNISHTGLTMTSGTDIDQVYTLQDADQVNNAGLGALISTLNSGNGTQVWCDTGIEGDMLSGGSYMVQLYVHEGGSGVFQTYYTGNMSWQGGTNGTETDEINLHSAGHDSKEDDGRGWFLRTECNTTGENGGKCKLQIRSDHASVQGGRFTIKLRRMM